MLPDLNRLKIFYYIFTLNSIVGAAKKLYLTQPGVSIHLKKLESELRMQLFIRLHKKMVPTAAGENLFKIVAPFIEELEIGIENIRRPINFPSGLLRIGMAQEFGKEYLPQICYLFRKKYPDVTFEFKIDETGPLLSLLSQGQLDFTITDYFFPKELLLENHHIYAIEPMIEEEFILACSKKYYESNLKGNHSYEHLVQKEFVTDEPDARILKYWFNHHFEKPNVDVNIVININSHQAAISCIKAGMGLGMTASHLVWDEINRGSIIPIKTDKKEVINQISLIQLQDKFPTITEKTFQTYLKKELNRANVSKRFSKISDL